MMPDQNISLRDFYRAIYSRNTEGGRPNRISLLVHGKYIFARANYEMVIPINNRRPIGFKWSNLFCPQNIECLIEKSDKPHIGIGQKTVDHKLILYSV